MRGAAESRVDRRRQRADELVVLPHHSCQLHVDEHSRISTYLIHMHVHICIHHTTMDVDACALLHISANVIWRARQVARHGYMQRQRNCEQYWDDDSDM